MNKPFFLIVVILIFTFIITGCGVSTPGSPSDHVEIHSVINRYFNAVFTLQYSQAKACLVPYGPTDKKLDVIYGQIASMVSYYIDIGCPPMVIFDIVRVEVNGQQAIAELGEVTVCLNCSLIGTECETSDEYSGKGMYFQKYNGEWRLY